MPIRRIAPAAAAALLLLVLAAPTTAAARVLRVGGFRGLAGQFAGLQAAADAARPGDWILVAPGDYKTTTSRRPAGRPDLPAAVLITTPAIHVRGLDRNAVIVDGTRSGPRCSAAAGDQNAGLNGIVVWRATAVSVENLTACNFLAGGGDTGNQIWFNGGDNSAEIGGWGYYGAYLNATSSYYGGESTAAQYGIFSSNWDGGTWYRDYASNFNDSGFYIGACQQSCNQVVDQVWSQYSALGYSGSNSGGNLVIKHSQFDHNEDGFDTNSQNGDNPPPQDGACPPGVISPITHRGSCWVFMHNYVHDNNNPDVPAAGLAASGPVGTGMSVSGGRDDTIIDNVFAHNDAWGAIFLPFLDSGPPCTGGTDLLGLCLFDVWGDELRGNTFIDNGGYGHPTNGDFAWVNIESGHPTSCWSTNHELGGAPVMPASAAALQIRYPLCDGMAAAAGSSDPRFLGEVLCDSQEFGPTTPCPSGQYPRATRVVMHPLPTRSLPTMPDPCAGVPANPWCPAARVVDTRRRR